MTQIIILPDEMDIVDQLAAVRRSLEQLKGLERLLVVGVRAEMGLQKTSALRGCYATAIRHKRHYRGEINADLMRADGIDPEEYRTPGEDVVEIVIEQPTGATNG
jgi:hypothetical protein